jgi:RNA polymerase sigma-70 factor, ECF subfamily
MESQLSYRRPQPTLPLRKRAYCSRISESGAAKGNLTDRRQRQSDGLNEVEAIERAKRGDAEAFEALYDLHKRRVYSLCWHMTANTAEAEDLTQEAFLLLFRKIGTFRGESAFSTWLHRMAVNVVLMHFRKKRLPMLSVEETTKREEDASKGDFGAEDVNLAGSIDRLQLQNAVDRLPPGYRAVFVLYAVEGYEHSEIAAMMGCSIGNSKSQLHKARMKLREFLKMNRAEKGRKKLRKLARVRAVSERYQTQFETCDRHESPPHAYC